MLRRILFVIGLVSTLPLGAQAQTVNSLTLGLQTGSEPRTVCAYDTSGVCVPIGSLDATTHVFNSLAASTIGAPGTTVRGGVFVQPGYADVTGLGSAANLPINPGYVRADVMPGSDMGAKINAAIALLPAQGGTVDATGLTGNQTLSTAITTSTINVHLKFGSAYITQSAGIQLAHGGSITCQPYGINQSVGSNWDGSTLFIQANSANLPYMYSINYGDGVMEGCVFDGNASHNPSEGPPVLITSSHFHIYKTGVQNTYGSVPGFYVNGYGSSCHDNATDTGTFLNVQTANTGGPGIKGYCSADIQVIGTWLENSTNGSMLELSDSPSWRITGGDFSGSVTGHGIYIHGNSYGSGGLTSQLETIVNADLGQNALSDIYIDGSNSGSQFNTIIGGAFGYGTVRTSGASASIEIYNSSVSGNIIEGANILSISGNNLSSAVYIHGTSGNDSVNGVRASGTFTGATFNIPATTSLSNACDTNAGICYNQNSQSLNAVFTGNTTSYSASARTAGATSDDQYAFSISNPSTAAYGTVEQDAIVAGLSASKSVFQRTNTGSGFTNYRYITNPSAVSVLTAIEGGALAGQSGCTAGTYVGNATSGTIKLTAACTSSTITLTFVVGGANGWNCPPLQDETNNSIFPITSGGSTTTAVFKGTGANNDIIHYGPCSPY